MERGKICVIAPTATQATERTLEYI